jgi:hypothetical protein
VWLAMKERTTKANTASSTKGVHAKTSECNDDIDAYYVYATTTPSTSARENKAKKRKKDA